MDNFIVIRICVGMSHQGKTKPICINPAQIASIEYESIGRNFEIKMSSGNTYVVKPDDFKVLPEDFVKILTAK